MTNLADGLPPLEELMNLHSPPVPPMPTLPEPTDWRNHVALVSIKPEITRFVYRLNPLAKPFEAYVPDSQGNRQEPGFLGWKNVPVTYDCTGEQFANIVAPVINGIAKNYPHIEIALFVPGDEGWYSNQFSKHAPSVVNRKIVRLDDEDDMPRIKTIIKSSCAFRHY